MARTLAARWRSGQAWLQDSVLAVVLVGLAFAPPLRSNGVALGELGHHSLGVTGSLLVSMRFPRPRAWLERLMVAALSTSKRVIRRPREEPAGMVARALERVSSVRLGYRVGWQAFGWALVNWTADVACLVCAVVAVRSPVPWRAILLVWSAGAGAASFCPVPAGLGVVDIVLITALTAAGLPAPHAVAAVLLYRIITFKIFFTLGWLGYRRLRERRHGGEAEADVAAGGQAGPP